ncbi:hypothetical protein DENSPDRAFT_72053 [Dentipellis sp. KUC8613]|nr:hypothetical protein DENSPDRAFT_72053 [Dentipellis sp. KUC8613]
MAHKLPNVSTSDLDGLNNVLLMNNLNLTQYQDPGFILVLQANHAGVALVSSMTLTRSQSPSMRLYVNVLGIPEIYTRRLAVLSNAVSHDDTGISAQLTCIYENRQFANFPSAGSTCTQ